MVKSFKTFLKHAGKDFYNQSVNPPVVRASTLIFKSIEDIRKTQNKYNKNPIFREGDTFTVCVNHSCNQYDYSEKDLNIVYVPKNDSERVVVTLQTHVISPPGNSDLRNLGIGIKSITIQKIE